jgi:hypothetical protein
MNEPAVVVTESTLASRHVIPAGPADRNAWPIVDFVEGLAEIVHRVTLYRYTEPWSKDTSA